MPREVLLHRGTKGAIYGVVKGDGTCPADDFIRESDKKVQLAFKGRFKFLCEAGSLKTPELMRRLEVPGSPPIYEIKVDLGPGWRLYVIRLGPDWIATHGSPKPKKSQVGKQAEKARQIYGER